MILHTILMLLPAMVGLTLSRLTDTETPSVIHVSNEASRPTGDLASSGSRVSASSVITLKDQSYYVDGVTAVCSLLSKIVFRI